MIYKELSPQLLWDNLQGGPVIQSPGEVKFRPVAIRQEDPMLRVKTEAGKWRIFFYLGEGGSVHFFCSIQDFDWMRPTHNGEV